VWQFHKLDFKKPGNPFFIIVVLLLISLVFCFFLPTSNPAKGQALGFVGPCQIQTYGKAWDGVMTFGLFNTSGNPLNFTVYNSYLVVMKTDGTLLSLRQSSGLNYFVVKDMGPDSLMFQGEPGQTTHFWNFTSNSAVDFPNVYGHHDVEYNPINNTFLNLRNYQRTINGSQIIFDKIVEEDANGNILWSWDTYDYIPLSDADLCNHVGELNGQPLIDFTHANAIQWDYNNSVVYLNLRHTNTFYKINMTTGNIIWACGEHGNFTLLDSSGKNVTSLWYHSHATWQVAPDVFTMFDNDFDNTTNPNECHSRMIEVALNEQNMTAWVSWSWEAPTQYWSPYFGKTDRLPNGDHIGVFGSPSHHFQQNAPWVGDDTGAVITEVNSTGSIVRTWTFPTGWSIYRIDEITELPAKNSKFDLEPVLLILVVTIAVLVPAILIKNRVLRAKDH
jgi:hypothetical protein